MADSDKDKVNTRVGEALQQRHDGVENSSWYYRRTDGEDLCGLRQSELLQNCHLILTNP